ncbi:hypothetical protein RRG08_031629 [Elysia crispata]|uniref:PDZ domain-containing protein n=1 Tax=Elysia crispata TaxID=231223 RepID=A0AAE1DV95_9GAST|nr:hypothetical protein RRG08_031629 [Elysia crispata]
MWSDNYHRGLTAALKNVGLTNQPSGEKVKELILKDKDRENLFEALRHYQSSEDLHHLIKDLRVVLDEPQKLELFEFLRPLILLRHQISYSQMVPPSSGVRLHIVRLQQQPRESLGFAVCGGFEHGIGIFVTDVTPGSQAHRQGLKIGDQIARVNGFTISEAVHEDVLRLIRSHDDIILKVIYIGMIPVQEKVNGTVIWKYVDDLSTSGEIIENYSNERAGVKGSRDIKIFIDSSGHASIGCTIISERGPAERCHGIFVEKVRPGSLADEVGMQPGDQILEVNNTSFRGITWEEAKLALKSSRQLQFTIRKNSLPVSLIDGYEDRSAEPEGLPAEIAPDKAPNSLPPSTVSEPSVAAGDKRSTYHYNSEVQAEGRWKHQHVSAQVHVKPPKDHRWVGNVQLYTATQDFREDSDQKTSPLGGAAAAKLEQLRLKDSGKSNNYPDLLELEGEFGWSDRVPQRIYEKFSPQTLEGKDLKCLTFKKASDLGVVVEGGLGSPLEGRIVVSMVFENGVAHRSGKIKIGDQLMMINGRQLLDVTLTEAEDALHNVSAKDKTVELIYCESRLVNDEDKVTYF